MGIEIISKVSIESDNERGEFSLKAIEQIEECIRKYVKDERIGDHHICLGYSDFELYGRNQIPYDHLEELKNNLKKINEKVIITAFEWVESDVGFSYDWKDYE